MRTLIQSGTTFLALLAMAPDALAKSHGMAALDKISDMFDSLGSNSFWLLIAGVAFVVYIAGSAHRA